MEEKLILVDENDNVIGTSNKLEVHQKGLLHRAFSILIFNTKGELLIQKRAVEKYHSKGLWSNTCCSHPIEGENEQNTINKKLKQEMGIVTEVQFAYHFIYKIELDNGLIENELDKVYIGEYEGEIKANPLEVSDFKWIGLELLRKEMASRPRDYTHWFKIIVNEHLEDFNFASSNSKF
ncbi:MAG: isopentenyl-diphosphate Delta-isomerase [Flavobacteriia bacterium]|nr:isopentenyl-diphosphate Delta-isomerase [Flavobacteriia bacterium]